ncbi:BlaI/MecI/CopY family transcriptional regulator [Bengtsoniella intestinalis]|uniref:BlaI/MecI/CopY family transcriptional regulator n=1 Tax=Bengtsoniella intestinalis TaxID=3073143 RepID=UPI00391F2281
MELTLTTAEWSVMERLWDKSPQTGREVVSFLEDTMEWSRSTTLTLLTRLEAKGAVGSDSSQGKKLFYPTVERSQVAQQETKAFLDRVYQGSLTMMVSAMTQEAPLSKEELAELYALLQGMEE